MSLQASPQSTRKLTSPLLSSDRDSTALIMLNTPMACPPSPLFDALWQSTRLHVCADGGANRLRRANKDLTPDLVVGDLDSLKSHVREYYEQRGVCIEKVDDQDTNDMEKALIAVEKSAFKKCIVYGGFGGRLDQEMASLHLLYVYKDRFEEMWMYNDETCAVLLQGQVEYSVELSPPARDRPYGEGPTCGIIPLGEPCESVTTRGLKWELTNNRTEFGGLLSTSNRMLGNEVSIHASHAVLFTTEVISGVKDDSEEENER
jgi:thiamine pyrophosphokinase